MEEATLADSGGQSISSGNASAQLEGGEFSSDHHTDILESIGLD